MRPISCLCLAVVLTTTGPLSADDGVWPWTSAVNAHRPVVGPDVSRLLAWRGRGGTAASMKPDEARVAELRRKSRPFGDWGGPDCPPATDLKALVDDYLATPHPDFPDLGSTVPGLSASWSSRDCGTFTYAAGLREVEDDKALRPSTLMGLASMTKAVIAAVTLKLNERGLFGPDGLDTPVDRLLTAEQIKALTTGDEPSRPRCPGATFLFNRQTGEYEWTAFSCPDLSQVTLRHLMVSNHGMYDFLNEVLLPTHSFQYEDGVYFDLFEFLGLSPKAPASATNGFDYLRAYGLKRNDSAVIGGNRFFGDLELSLGNTGFQLLGIILENQTGQLLQELIREHIVEPLRIDDMLIHVTDAPRPNRIADGYQVHTGDQEIERAGVYPLIALNGHAAVNTLSLGLGLPANVNLAGGAGGLVANMPSYRVFLDALVNGGLLGPGAQAELNGSFVLLPDLTLPGLRVFNGLGLVKQVIRGFPGLPDFDILLHNGRLPGVGCENAVVLRPDPSIAPVTGSFCINSGRLAYPDPNDLLRSFVSAITAANPLQESHGTR